MRVEMLPEGKGDEVTQQRSCSKEERRPRNKYVASAEKKKGREKKKVIRG